jgi:hypothetical protein
MIRCMVDTPLEDTTSMTVSSNLNTVSSDSIVDKLKKKCEELVASSRHIWPYLVVLVSKLVQAFLNDMVSVQVLDEHYHMQAKRDNDRMYLSIVSEISLFRDRKCDREMVIGKLNSPVDELTKSQSFSEQHECRACSRKY